MNRACHSQLNCYDARLKIWGVFQTEGELSCGTFRYSKHKPEGEKLNNAHLSRTTAIYIASRVPGGGVIHSTSSESFNVYSEQRILRFREILKRVRKEHTT